MSLLEAARLAKILLTDPSSATAAASQDWDYPISQEASVLADLFDLTFAANSDPKKARPKPHAIRPWKQQSTQRYGNTGGRSREQVLALLADARNGAA